MGTDINGWVEVYASARFVAEPWTAVVKIDALVERNYGVFGSLFGVRNEYGFRPIAPSRGLPEDVSQDLKDSGDVPLDDTSMWPSWITWREIRDLDWQERGAYPAPGVGQTEYATREDVVTLGWKTLFAIMERLATQFGEDGVRLIVWFG